MPCSLPGTQVRNQTSCMATNAGSTPGPSRPASRAGVRHKRPQQSGGERDECHQADEPGPEQHLDVEVVRM